MIIRISGEDQYRLADGDERLGELDNAVVDAVDAGDERAFAAAYEAMLDYVRSEGSVLNGDELIASDVILPPADLTMAEAASEFTGEGLLPDD